MAAETLLDRVVRMRQEEQLDDVAEEPSGLRDETTGRFEGVDSWEIAGPPRCVCCHTPMDEGTVDARCPACRPVRKPKVCGITGCTRPARANGRCRRHVHGDVAPPLSIAESMRVREKLAALEGKPDPDDEDGPGW